MIFGSGLFMFVFALVVSLLERPKKAHFVVALTGCAGLIFMLLSICMLVAKVMP